MENRNITLLIVDPDQDVLDVMQANLKATIIGLRIKACRTTEIGARLIPEVGAVIYEKTSRNIHLLEEALAENPEVLCATMSMSSSLNPDLQKPFSMEELQKLVLRIVNPK